MLLRDLIDFPILETDREMEQTLGSLLRLGKVSPGVLKGTPGSGGVGVTRRSPCLDPLPPELARVMASPARGRSLLVMVHEADQVTPRGLSWFLALWGVLRFRYKQLCS